MKHHQRFSVASVFAVCAVLACALPAIAQHAEHQAASPDGKADAKAEEKSKDKGEKPKYPEPVGTDHELTIAGATIAYKATAGTLPLRDDAQKLKAEVFFISYERTGVSDKASRPITFAFNGGPGSSSVWLHMGALGPRRALFGPDGEALPPPARLGDNEFSWLDATDLVFIDPVSTGYSRAAEGEDAHQFHGLNEDVRAVGEFIRLWLTRNARWTSPKYLVGESYGTTRAAGLAQHLQTELGVYLNGIVLVSTVLQFQTLDFANGNDTPYWLYLPAYAATAWYHKTLAPELQSLALADVIAQAEQFAAGDYLLALAKGDALTDAQKSEIASRLSRLTSLSPDYLLKSNLRVPQWRFCKELLRARGQTVGRLDARYTGIDKDEASENAEYDPSYAAIQGAFTAALNQYVRAELKYESDLNYEILTGKVHPWKFASDSRYPQVADNLRRGMAANPSMRVLVCMGEFDLATPPFAAEYTLRHMDIPEGQRGNITRVHFPSGHMMYIRQDDLRRLKQAAAEFMTRAP